MRLLLDESVPQRLRRALPNHEVKTVVEMGWGGIKNGDLLALAAPSFDAFITVDKNLPYQQNLSSLALAVV
jgi:predicted nuclease of predicted toxin-antitoxin system